MNSEIGFNWGLIKPPNEKMEGGFIKVLFSMATIIWKILNRIKVKYIRDKLFMIKKFIKDYLKYWFW